MSALCSHCGFPLPENGTGLRHFGTHTAHQEYECLRILRWEIEQLRAALAEQAQPANTCNGMPMYEGPLSASQRQDTTPTAPQSLTERELDLLDGMIEVQLHHAAQCDLMLARAGGNHTMAERQKGWDMERVELLRKIKRMEVQR